MDDASKKYSDFFLTLSGDGVKVEKNIDEATASRILTLIIGGRSTSTAVNVDKESVVVETQPITDGASPKQFMTLKRPMSDIERITCLAYYLTHFRGVSHFKTEELTALNREAAQPNFSNATVAARNAVQRNFLSLAGGAKKQITSWGESLVDALPERDRVKNAIENMPTRKRRSNGSKKKDLKIDE